MSGRAWRNSSACLLPLSVAAAHCVACAGDGDRVDSEARAERPDAPEFARRGPFLVGYKPVLIDEGSDRQLDAGVWYPARSVDGAKERVTYRFTLNTPAWRGELPSVAYGRAIRDAPADRTAGPHPLVIFSHGFTANAAWYHTLLEHYASYGFVVIAPEHAEQFDESWSGLAAASIDRPTHIVQTLDYAEKLASPDGAMAGEIDMRHIAVVGHSYGGYTALAMAGARYDLDAFIARCNTLPPDDPKAFLCLALAGKSAALAEHAGLAAIPDGLWPSRGDPRVTAIIPMAGDAYLFDRTGLAEITIPMMAIGGTADTSTPYEWGSKPSYDHASSPQKTLVSFVGGEHFLMTSPCNSMPWTSQFVWYELMCFDPVWDKSRATDLVHHVSTAFLLDTLKGDARARVALLPEEVHFPGIRYSTTGPLHRVAVPQASVSRR